LAIHFGDAALKTNRKHRHLSNWMVKSVCRTGPGCKMSFNLTPLVDLLDALSTTRTFVVVVKNNMMNKVNVL